MLFFLLVITQRSVNQIASEPASEEMRDAAFAWIDKLSVKNGTYPPDSYPNPGKIGLFSCCSTISRYTALAFHNEQLQASAFREQYDPESFEDLTEPKVEMIHKASIFKILFYSCIHKRSCAFQRAGKLMKEWKTALSNHSSSHLLVATTGSKRKAVCL